MRLTLPTGSHGIRAPLIGRNILTLSGRNRDLLPNRMMAHSKGGSHVWLSIDGHPIARFDLGRHDGVLMDEAGLRDLSSTDAANIAPGIMLRGCMVQGKTITAYLAISNQPDSFLFMVRDGNRVRIDAAENDHLDGRHLAAATNWLRSVSRMGPPLVGGVALIDGISHQGSAHPRLMRLLAAIDMKMESRHLRDLRLDEKLRRQENGSEANFLAWQGRSAEERERETEQVMESFFSA
ncbi:hypothetical protein [Defluviimonas salinarum]|uniref:Uncharacterized protein n=1 Tax=Defluviimonas salinarum TaxID=2992147 RepID=A0ABT3J9F8_9RHOB|nr:hypothetical protein [Defluviimonas salinarum]MCW3784310.1 hypothetical protein [Defluviimonas salinarum]